MKMVSLLSGKLNTPHLLLNRTIFFCLAIVYIIITGIINLYNQIYNYVSYHYVYVAETDVINFV